MKSPDLNVLIAAFREDHSHHSAARAWLVDTLRAGEALGLSPAVATGVVRVLTTARMWPGSADSIEQALGHIEQLRRNRAVSTIAPGPRHWEIFADLCRATGARGSFVADIAHAAVAIEHGATWVTFDSDFARVPALRYEILR